MKDIDWSKAPEGYPVWAEALGGVFGNGWHKDAGDRWIDEAGCYWLKDAETRGTVRIHRAPWNGIDLPPVGVVCLTEHEGKELEVEILAYGKHGNYDAVLVAERAGQSPGVMYGWIAEQCEFRPIRTPKQTAVEEREVAIKDMVDRFALYSRPDIQWRALFEHMYDCGCRMTAEDER